MPINNVPTDMGGRCLDGRLWVSKVNGNETAISYNHGMDSQSRHILLIEDDPAMADSLQQGLAISQSIINAHGGRIEVASQPGETWVTVRLPLSESPRIHLRGGDTLARGFGRAGLGAGG